SDAFLFKPAEAINMPPGTENGTPLPKDEPFAENPAYGAYIDYYLKSASTAPVTLEILDAAGKSIRRYSSDDRPPPVDHDSLNIPACWVRPPEILAASPGMHRFVWDLRPGQDAVLSVRAGSQRAGGGRGGRGGAGGSSAGGSSPGGGPGGGGTGSSGN